jgi:multimeric flavodoxin WrbA/putative sterol carrier protein
MKILALNSSPRKGGQSKTELMLHHLVGGMRDEGAEVEIVNLREKTVNPCIGCFTCWTKTPGKCIHKDDMTNELFPKWLKSDLVVYATPLYYHFMNAAMSAFRERTLPAVQPFFAFSDGITYHPLRQKVPAVVWLSVCGFPEGSEFDALSDFLNRTRHKDVELVAEIYRPSAERLSSPLFKEQATDILDATTQAGRELVRSVKIAPETMARIRQPMVDSQSFIVMGNLYWKTCIAEGVTPKEFKDKNMVPRPDTLESFMSLLPFVINSEAAGNKKVVLQFKFSGAVEDSCYFTIKKDDIDKQTGTCEIPDVEIETPFDLWMDIMTGKADPRQMLMEKKYKVMGEIALMAQLFQRKSSG